MECESIIIEFKKHCEYDDNDDDDSYYPFEDNKLIIGLYAALN